MIFISYRRSDSQGFAHRLADSLKRAFAAHLVFIDSESIWMGDKWATSIADAERRSLVVLAVIGKEWLSARDEHGRRRIDDPNDVLRRELAEALRRNIQIVPLYLDDAPVLTRKALPRALSGLVDNQPRRVYSDERYKRDVEALIDELARIHARQTSGAGLPAAHRAALAHVFVGREQELSRLRALLQNERKKCVVVDGLPGVGKTALISRFVADAEAGRWYEGGVHLLRREDIVANDAAQVSYTRSLNDAQNVSQTLDRLASGPPALIVLDDVTGDEQALPVLQQSGTCQVLIGSRRGHLPSVIHLGAAAWGHVSLEPLDTDASRTLLRILMGARASAPDSYFDALSRSVEGLPLALEWIGTLFHHPLYQGVSQERFLEEVNKRLGTDQKWRDLFTVCLELIGPRESAGVLLAAALFFDPAEIPIAELREVTGLPADELSAALDAVTEVGVLRPDRSGGRCVSMHSLIHEVATQTLQTGAYFRSLRPRFVRRMTDKLLTATSYAQARPLAPHVRRAVESYLHAEDVEAMDRTLDDRLYDYNFHIADRILPGAASVRLWEKLATHRAADLTKRTSAALAVYQTQLGKAHLRLGRLADARTLLEAAIATFGGDPVNARFKGRALGLLGELLCADGRPREAIARLKTSQQIQCEKGAPDDIRASLLRKLSHAYHLEGRFSAAARCLQEAVDIHEKLGSTNDIAFDRCRIGVLQALTGHLDAAERNLREAKRLHDEGSGRNSAYAAYDLNRLGDVLRRRGLITEAIACLDQARSLHERFYGADSSNVAIDMTRLAEAYLDLGDFDSAGRLAEEARALHCDEFGDDSGHCAYDLTVLAEIARRRARVRSDPKTAQEDLKAARAAAQDAVRILQGTPEDTIHQIRAWTQLGHVLSDLDDGEGAQRNFWSARQRLGELGLQTEVEQLDIMLADSIFRSGSRDWGESATAYARYLDSNPDCVLLKLSGAVADRISDELAEPPSDPLDGATPPVVLDLCCGVGTLARDLRRRRLNVRVIGLDNLPMIEIAGRRMAEEESPGSGSATVVEFLELRGDWAGRLAGGPRPRVAVLGMSIFQFSPRHRHVIFRSLSRILAPGALLLISTSSTDFRMPDEAGPDVNAVNPFKSVVYRAAESYPLELTRPLAQAISPVFPKDDAESVGLFLSLYGFETVGADMRFVPHERDIREHVDFSRLPVISMKVFGRELPPEFWDSVVRSTPSDYRDCVVGAVLSARFRGLAADPPLFFSGTWDGPEGNQPVRYATAAVLRRRNGDILLVRRGAAVRDYPHAWSLPSAMADPGLSLAGSLAQSLVKHLDLRCDDLRLVSVRLAPRRDAADEPWVIAMCLFEGTTSDDVTPRSAKYEAHRWVPGEALCDDEDAGAAAGDCLTSLRDFVAHRDVQRLGNL